MTGPGYPNERGWLVIVTTGLLVMILVMLYLKPELAKEQLFVALASGVVGSAFLAVLGMWTSATKAGSELVSKALDNAGPSLPPTVTIDNTAANPVPTTDTESKP